MTERPVHRPGRSKDDRLVSPAPSCRFCGAGLRHTFLDLGFLPLSGKFLPPDKLDEAEPLYALRVFVCARCFLVQAHHGASPQQLFGEYAYFSSYSKMWLEHARRYVEMITDRLRLTSDSLVVEIASNDGYLLQHFLELGVRVLGIEPATNIARRAREKGVPTRIEFFDVDTALRLASAGTKADLIVGNNILAHVPDPLSFVNGLRILLRPGGVITMEFPHLAHLIEENQFDTIYHEHFSYFSFLFVEQLFAACALAIFDVEELPTHGGSLRIYAQHQGASTLSERVLSLRQCEQRLGLSSIETYGGFEQKVKETKRMLLDFLTDARRTGKRVAAYGAPAKGNTLLNYCGIRSDLIEFTVDRNPYKQGKYLPGSRIPIFTPDCIDRRKPDYLLILPWNLKDEIMMDLTHIHDWGGRFVVPIPEVRVYS
jgi:SAM-dependent methyltransferase